ncbi:DNA topoisomerase (plasmid) [Dyella sp. BiH032]|uniref:DNA topoisomerase n=1 Tax=Dyella sp. BiH032 TaxID=3075430 RepID=UPI00289319AA|nr:DNA topoisomerase [Dyella sp. BiH032]WNL48558.1 DNA topoisomerase [Dyella sp. BiH032]
MRVWICEKKDQAERLAPLLGNAEKGRHCFNTADGLVVHAQGHLLGDPEPAQLNPAWEKWTMESLPIIPERWRKTGPAEDYKKALLSTIGDAIKKATEVVIATDPGAEGEAIARELLEHFKYRGPIKRLWVNALDPVSIRKAVAQLRDGSETIGLYHSALARGRGDYVHGKSLSRAYTLLARAGGEKAVRHVGRVKTPTLGLVVRRDAQIAGFVAQTYYELELEVQSGGQVVKLYHAPEQRIFDRAQAEALVQRVRGAQGAIGVEAKEKRQSPPGLFNLSKLQKHMSSKFGWDVDHTLDVAQSLYNAELTTYPRTAGAYIPNEQAPSIPTVLRTLATIGPLAPHVSKLIVQGHEVRDSIYNTKKLEGEEHHAIVPNPEGVAPDPAQLSDDERTLYVVIAQSYLAGLLPDYRYNETAVSFNAAGVPFGVVGKMPTDKGWRAVYNGEDPDEDEQEEASALPPLKNGAQATTGEVSLLPKKTKAPKRYTQGDLVVDMANVAKYVSDPAVRAILKETSGIGTDATRSTIVTALIADGYLEKKGKFIQSTVMGQQHIINEADPSLSDPSLTALWELRLSEMRAQAPGAMNPDQFVNEVAAVVTRLVNGLRPRVSHAVANRAPTANQIEYIEKLERELAVGAPVEARRSFAAAKAFIDTYAPVLDKLPPSTKAIEFAEKIAAAAGVVVPEQARQERKACAEFIEAHKAALPPRKTTKRKKKS